MKKINIILLMLMFITGMLILSACSGEASETDTPEKEQKKGNSADLSQFADEEGELWNVWNDLWSMETAGGGSIDVDLGAKVEIPELQQMSVVEVQKYTFNEENKKKMAESVFDGDFDGDYKGNDYIGKREGIQYRLSFHDENGLNEINMTAQDLADVFPDWSEVRKEGYYAQPAHISLEVHNKCKVVKADAEKTAREFLQKAGFTDLILADEQTLQWIGKENPVIDGWFFIFSPGVENMPLSDSLSDYLDYYDDSQQISGSFSPDCSITVKVTDKGVIEAKIENPIVISSVTSKVKLLPLEEIKKIFHDEIRRFAETNDFLPSMRFDSLTLGYCRISDPVHKDMYTYVPAWELGSKIEPYIIMVNAMDGSMINDLNQIEKRIRGGGVIRRRS